MMTREQLNRYIEAAFQTTKSSSEVNALRQLATLLDVPSDKFDQIFELGFYMGAVEGVTLIKKELKIP